MKERSKTDPETKPAKALHLPFIVPLGVTQNLEFVSTCILLYRLEKTVMSVCLYVCLSVCLYF